MEETLISLLLANSSLTAIVGNRIRPVDRPQTDTLPSITIQRIDGIREYLLSGPSGLVSSRVQIDCWGKTYTQSKITARAVALALSGIKDPFQGCFLVDETDSSEDAEPNRIFRTRLDFQVLHNN